MKKILLALFLTCAAINIHAAIINIPGDQPTIQAGIDASINGDTVEVQPGTYFENINLNGKKILLTSLYYLTNDTTYIQQTIINGSQPINPDTGSCVLFIQGEDSTCVLQGFTITGGSGTIWLDPHGAGFYREGGGILTAYTSPTIRFNRIIFNNATTFGGNTSSAGGGGIRVGDGHPIITNNVIAYNKGRYGAGIVLNYTGVYLANNLIAFNSGGQDYGGGGIWNNYSLAGYTKRIENNTIVYNNSLSTGGGIYVSGTTLILRNNIVWGNTANVLSTSQFSAITSSVANSNFNDVEGTFNSLHPNNINVDPNFFDISHFWLPFTNSPCIDAGDTTAAYNDVSDPVLPAIAKFPSRAFLTNDIGAYGGPGAALMPGIDGTVTGLPSSSLTIEPIIYPNPTINSLRIRFTSNDNFEKLIKIYDALGKMVLIQKISGNDNFIEINTSSYLPGIYNVVSISNNTSFSKNIIIGTK